MKFCFALSFSPLDQYVPLAKAADEHGWHAVACSDHVVNPETITSVYPYTADGGRRWEPFTEWPDCWVSIGAMAGVTERLQFFTNVYDTYGDAGILAILAHEVGHAIDGASKAPWMKSNWSPELRADAWAGCALARMSLKPRALNGGYAALSNYSPQSRPDWPTRLPVIETGYKQCGGK